MCFYCFLACITFLTYYYSLDNRDRFCFQFNYTYSHTSFSWVTSSRALVPISVIIRNCRFAVTLVNCCHGNCIASLYITLSKADLSRLVFICDITKGVLLKFRFKWWSKDVWIDEKNQLNRAHVSMFPWQKSSIGHFTNGVLV